MNENKKNLKRKRQISLEDVLEIQKQVSVSFSIWHFSIEKNVTQSSFKSKGDQE